MVDGQTEQDIERLRAAYLLTDRHAKKLANEVIQLKAKIAELEGRTLTQEELDLPLPELLEVSAGNESHREEVTALDDIPQEKVNRPGHGPRRQPKLPVEYRYYELPDDELVCACCGKQRKKVGEQTEDSEEITVVERTYKLVVHKRQKYSGCDCDTIFTAKAPARLVKGGRYSNDLIATVAIDKYADNIPLERQVDRMRRVGLELTSATLVDQLHALTELFVPVWRELFIWIHDNEPVLNVDETGWRLAEKKKEKRRPTAWCVSSPRAVVHHILASKSTKMAQTLLGEYDGIVVADGYQVYKSLSRAEGKSGFTLANCWAHCLRKFRDCLESEPDRAKEVLHLIGLLYRVEAEVAGPFPGDADAQAQRLELRQTWSSVIAERIREWAFSQGGLKRSDFGTAIAYMLKRWNELTCFLENPLIPLDNNHAERSLRKLVTGRKVHYGSRSQAGLRFAEVHYSLIDSCRLNDVDPLAYYKHLIAARLDDPSVIILPHEYAEFSETPN